MATTTVVSTAQALRQPNTYSFTAGQPVPVGVLGVTLIPNISLSDKLAVGNTLSCQIFANGMLIAGGSWQSYGPGGIIGPGGVSNPDPAFDTSDISKYVGQILSASFDLPQAMTVGLTVTVTT